MLSRAVIFGIVGVAAIVTTGLTIYSERQIEHYAAKKTDQVLQFDTIFTTYYSLQQQLANCQSQGYIYPSTTTEKLEQAAALLGDSSTTAITVLLNAIRVDLQPCQAHIPIVAAPLAVASSEPSPTPVPTPSPKTSPSLKATPTPTKAPAATGGKTASTQTSNYEEKSVTTDRGTFTVLLMTLDLTKPGATLVTDTSTPNDCANNCPVKSLSQFVSDTGGFAGLNGTYFCPTAYSDCAGKTNSFYYKIWNTITGRMVNESNGLGEFLPFLAVDSNNKARFFRQWVDYKSAGISLKAGISSRPLLTYNSQNVLDESTLETTEKTKSNRSMIGVKGQVIYAGIVKNATVPESAAVTTALGLEGAINLDAGGSSGMIYPGAVSFSGRLLPNAIIFKE